MPPGWSLTSRRAGGGASVADQATDDNLQSSVARLLLTCYVGCRYRVGADGDGHDTAAPRPEASELALLKLLREQPAVRENLPLVTAQNARATGTNLNDYFSEGHGLSTFARESGTVYHCYSSYARGTEFLMVYYGILDRAPKGRDEGDQPMSWLRRHDEYHN